MRDDERRAAKAAYRERKVLGGVYAVRCEASGDIWVGQWPDIETIRTRLWFTLRQGAHPNRDLLAAWRRYGEAQFLFEVLEKLEEESSSYIRNANLQERASYWGKKLGARSI